MATKVNSIELDEDGYPKNIQISMSAKTAAEIARWAGSIQGGSPDYLWNALVGSVFHPYWEDGLDEALQYLSKN